MPPQQPTMGSVPNATQDEPMKIDPMCFELTSWVPLNRVGKIRYIEFVKWMIKRVQYNQCTWLECRRLIDLIATEHNWDFMNLAMGHLPKLNERHPLDKKNFGRGFLWLLRPRYGQRMWDKARNNFIPERDRHVMGLSRAEVDFLKLSLFGPARRPGDYEHMDSLFGSTFELPQPALDQVGLPMNLHMPERRQEPLAGPPGIQRAPAERADFRAWESYNRPIDDFLRDFQKPGQALDHPPQTMPGPGLVAARSKSKVKDSNSMVVGRSDPIDISYPKLPK